MICENDLGVANWIDKADYDRVVVRCWFYDSAHPDIQTEIVRMSDLWKRMGKCPLCLVNSAVGVSEPSDARMMAKASMTSASFSGIGLHRILQNTTPVYREPAVAVNGLIVRLDGKAIIYWSIKDG